MPSGFELSGLYLGSEGPQQTVRVLDLGAGQMLHEFTDQPDAISLVSYQPDAGVGLTGSLEGPIQYWRALDTTGLDRFAQLSSLGSGQENRLYGHQSAVTALAIHPDGRVAASGGADGTIRLWNLPPVGPQSLQSQSSAVRALAIAPDGTLVARWG